MQTDAHWRDSARSPKLGIFDYRATFPLLFLLFKPSWLAFIIVIVTMLFLSVFERFGFTLTVFWRWIRFSFLAGKHKATRPWWLRDR